MLISSAELHGGYRALDYVLVPLLSVLYEAAIPALASSLQLRGGKRENDKLQ